MSRAFVFPGQASQAVGMGAELAAAFPTAREVFEDWESSLKSMFTLVINKGWHIGIRSGVRLAPITPATWATARTSPFAIFPF